MHMAIIKGKEIEGLYRLRRSDINKVNLTYLSAFRNYPKLMNAFPRDRERLFALEATLRYYTAYDMTYGSAYSLDENINEAVMLIHSDNMNYTLAKHIAAGSYSKEYRKVIRLLSKRDRAVRTALFKELDRLEADIDIPRPHIYLDFLGVAQKCQHQGRGRKLMEKVCEYADSANLPIMLFTNTSDDVRFYESLGFRIIGKTVSDTFGFTNTYMMYGI